MSLIAWYPLNGTTKDRVSNVSLSTSGSPVVASGKLGKCYNLNKAGFFYTTSSTMASTEMTFSLWVKFTDSLR